MLTRLPGTCRRQRVPLRLPLHLVGLSSIRRHQGPKQISLGLGSRRSTAAGAAGQAQQAGEAIHQVPPERDAPCDNMLHSHQLQTGGLQTGLLRVRGEV